MKNVIEEYLDAYITANNLKLTDEQYQRAYNGVEFWLTTNLPDAASDSVTNVI
ncbi:hypothetical protein [Metabacillus sp. SLBN-84]